MRLLLMRHGPAIAFAPSGCDEDRPLRDDGPEVVRSVLLRLASEHYPSVILSSPALRALETARIAAGITRASVRVEPRLSAGSSVGADDIQELALPAASTMLVGHQPWIEDLARELLGRSGSDLRTVGFRPACLVVLEHEPGGWHVLQAIEP